MSSRSRKEAPRKAAQVPAAHGAHPVPAGAAAETHPDHGLFGDDVIHVPKGRNRVQFVVMIALLVLLTVIFLVPGALVQTFLGGDEGNPEVLAYGPPTDRTVIRAKEYQVRRNGFSDVFDIPVQGFAFLKFFVGIQDRSLSEESAARLIVLDDLAQKAGIVITDEELAQFLTEMGADRTTWRSITARYGGPGKIESSLKRVLGIRRYLELVGQVARIPDMAAIEKRWAEEHVEVAYDYVEVPVDTFVEEAKASAPADPELEAWLATRPEFERGQFLEPVRYGATFAVFKDTASTPATGLLERYPDTSGEAPDVRAQAYYDQVFFTRFARPEPAPDDAGGDEPAEPPTPYQSFEEVKERALAEAPVYFALQAWRADVDARLAGGAEVDFPGEAGELGLAVARTESPATLAELRAREDLGDFAGGQVATTEPGKVASRVVADAEGMSVLRVDEKLEPSMPPFEKIREEVLASWAKERAAELAVEKLEALRAGFEAVEAPAPVEPPPEGEAPPADPRKATAEAFREAAQAAGFTVGERPWLDKSGQPTDDPLMTEPSHVFLGQHREYAELAEGEVPAPALDRERARAYLVRVAGKRPMDLARMTPPIYNGYKGGSAMEPANQVRVYLTGPELDQRYAIDFLNKSAEPAEDEEVEGEPDQPAIPPQPAEGTGQ